MFDKVRAAYRAAPQDAYWARRFCELALVTVKKEARDEALLRDLVSAVARVSMHDPEFVVGSGRIEVGRQFGVYTFPLTAMEELDRAIRLEDASLEHHVKGILWVAAGAYRHTENASSSPFYERAVAHLLQVNKAEREEEFYVCLCEAVCDGAYHQLASLLDEILEGVHGFWRSSVLVTILGASSEKKDWPLFDRCRPLYDPVSKSGEHPLDDCAVMNFDGLRLLAKEETSGLAALVQSLLKRGMNVQFLGTPDTLVLIHELVARRMLLDECDAYLAMADRSGRSKPISALREGIKAARS